jgi:uncharacterized membrane protein (UPF0127 family)
MAAKKTFRILKHCEGAVPIVVAENCLIADHFFSRLRGLIGRKTFEPGEGLLFPKCNDIHMWFMSMRIDVVFLKKVRGTFSWQITSFREGLRPWRPLPVRDSSADDTLELPAGTIARCGLVPGDAIEVPC